MKTEERRNFPRIDRTLPIKYEIINPDSHTKIIGISNTKNISVGGIRLPSAFPIKKNALVNFKLHLDTGTNIELQAVVVWTQNSLRYKTIAGLKFANLPENNKTIISNYIQEILQVG